MFAQLIQALYNIVDSYFVGKYSPDGLTALSVIFPVQLIITALAVGTGVGVNTQMARLYAQKKEKEADETAGTGIALSFFTWILFAILSALFMASYVATSAKSEAAIQYGITYGKIVAAVITGTRGFRMPPAFHEMKNCIKWIYRLGYPSILMQMLYTVYIVALNIILAGFSDAAVTVLGLYYKMQTFFFIPLLGLQTCIVPAVISLLSPVFFQAIGNAKASALLSLIRQLGCLIPIFRAFSKLGLVYTWIAFPAAEVITGVIGIVLYIRQIKQWSAA